MRLAVAAVAVAFGIVVGGLGVARGQDDEEKDEGASQYDKALIDRIDVRPSILPGLVRVRALVSATKMRGHRIDAPASKIALKIGGDHSPAMVGYFATADVEVSLVLLVPTTLEFEPELDAIKTYLDSVLLQRLSELGPRVRVQVMGYGESYTGSKGLVKVDAARKALAALSSDGSSEAPDLADAVDRAIKAAATSVKRPKAKGALGRGMVVVVSSGVLITDENRDLKDRLTKLAEKAAKAQVRIHSLGYSPPLPNGQRARRPLLALGELSKGSQGTFRWIVLQDGWKRALETLADQIALQYVVTFFAPAEEIAGKKLGVSIASDKLPAPLEAEAVKLGEPKCAKEVCEGNAYCAGGGCVQRRLDSGRGVLAWILLIGGIGAGVVVLAIGVFALVGRLRRAPATTLPTATAVNAPAYPAAPPAHGVPVAPVAHALPVMIVMTGPHTGARLPLRPGFLIGKAPGSDLDLSHDGYASTNHAQIVFEQGTWMLYDRGSTNGTFSNGVRITQTRLSHGMTIRFGSTDVRFSEQ